MQLRLLEQQNKQRDMMANPPYNDSLALIRLLLADDRINPDSKDYNGRSPLSYAAEHGHEAVVKLLLEAKADVGSRDDHFGRTCCGMPLRIGTTT